MITVIRNEVVTNLTVTQVGRRGAPGTGGGGEGGASTFAELTDAATADLVAINGPLGTAISGKLSISTAAATYQPLAATLTGTTASFTTELKTKLDGIEAGATADQDLSGYLTTAAAGSAYAPIATTVTLSGAQTVSGKTLTDYTEVIVAIGTVTTAATLSGTSASATLTAGVTCAFAMPTAISGKSLLLHLYQAATTGGGNATFTGVRWPGGTAPTITATAGKKDIVSFACENGIWWGSSVTPNYTA